MPPHSSLLAMTSSRRDDDRRCRRSLRCLSTCTTRQPLRQKRRRSHRDLSTSWKSATAVKCLAARRRKRVLSPLKPRYSILRSASIKPTLGARSSKKALAKGRLSTVIRMSGYANASDLITGTVMATSPNAEKRMISRWGRLISVCTIQDWWLGRYTSSSDDTLSCISCQRQYPQATAGWRCSGRAAAQ